MKSVEEWADLEQQVTRLQILLRQSFLIMQHFRDLRDDPQSFTVAEVDQLDDDLRSVVRKIETLTPEWAERNVDAEDR